MNWRVGRVARAVAPWTIALIVSTASSAAFAGAPSPEDRSTARELALEGHNALKAGDYALAVDRFTRADRLVHAPTLLVDLARSYMGLGRLVQAHEAFQQVMREGVAADAPASWHKALQVARDEDNALKPRLAWVTIRVEGATAPRVKLDDEDLAPASLGVRRAVDPGNRSVVVEAEGFLTERSTIDLNEGEAREVALSLKRDPDYRPPPKPRPRERPVIVVEAPSQRQRLPAYVAFGVGGAGLILGSVSGVLMLKARGDLEATCAGRGGSCPADTPNFGSNISAYHTFGTLSAVGFGVGLAGVGVGTYFLLSRPTKARASGQGTIGAQLSPGYVGVRGSF
jgi:hypothetical protein